MPLTTGRSKRLATRIPTWKPPASADSFPNRIRSNAPSVVSTSAIASERAVAVRCGSQSTSSMGISTKWWAPTLAAYRSCSSASVGPRVMTVTSPPWVSVSWTASSTAHSSCGLVVKPRWAASTAWPSTVTLMRAPGAGTRLTQTRILIRAGSGLHPRVVRIEDGTGGRHLHRVQLIHVHHL